MVSSRHKDFGTTGFMVRRRVQDWNNNQQTERGLSTHTTSPDMLNTDCYTHHAQLLFRSCEQWTRRQLLSTQLPDHKLATQLFYAPLALLSHGPEGDPIFNFGNQTARNLFEMSWDALTKLASRESAEPVNRQERARLLERVNQNSFISDYRGIRISATGKRFAIERATVWNVVDEQN